jgi:SulP family sulfate permease
MVNGATGAFAAIIATFIPESGEGLEYLFPSVILGGFFMILFKVLQAEGLVKLVPDTVMIGFCNGLAIVIGLAQLHPFHSKTTASGWVEGAELGWMMLIAISSMLIMEYFPKLPFAVAKILPSSLLAVVSALIIEWAIVRNTGSSTKTIGDVSPFDASTALPIPFFLDPKLDMGKLILDGPGIWRIVHQGVMLALVGVIESLMTQEVVNELTKTEGQPGKTVVAMAFANSLSGFMGGMGGNAMIGLSTVNALNGGRTRLAPCVTALGVLLMVAGCYPVLNYIPVAALTGVMIVVVLHTFKWSSLGICLAAILPQSTRESWNFHRKINFFEVITFLVVTVVTIATNLVYAVFVGTSLAGLIAAWEIGKKVNLTSDSVEGSTPTKVYMLEGPLFFGSKKQLMKLFDVKNDPLNVELHLSKAGAPFDYSALVAINTIISNYEQAGKKFRVKTIDCPEVEAMIQDSAKLFRHIEGVQFSLKAQERKDSLSSESLTPKPLLNGDMSKWDKATGA